MKTGFEAVTTDPVEDDDKASGIDEEDDDRTHRVQLRGKVEIASVKLGTHTHPLGMKVPVKVKKEVEVRVVFVGSADAYQTEFVDFVKVARERFAQAGVRLLVDYRNMPVPAGTPPWTPIDDTAVRHHDGAGGTSQGGGNMVHQNLKDIVDAASADPAVGRRDFTIFVVQRIFQPPSGETDRGKAVTRRLTDPRDHAYARTAILSAQDIVSPPANETSWFTLAHELGHLLTDNGHYGTTHNQAIPGSQPLRGEYGPDQSDPSVSRNLMKDGTTPGRGLNGSKRLLREQEKMILKELEGAP